MVDENKSENNTEKKDVETKKNYTPVIVLAILVFGIVGALQFAQKNNSIEKIKKNDKIDDANNSAEVKLSIDVKDDKQWAEFTGYVAGKQLSTNLNQYTGLDEADKYKEDFYKGFEEAFKLGENDDKFTQEEIQKAYVERAKYVQEKLKQKAEENKKLGKEYIEKFKKEKDVKELEDGVYYKVVKNGNGDVVGEDNIAKVSFVVKNIKGEVLESMEDKKVDSIDMDPAMVKQILPGLGVALEKMKVGDKWEIVVYSDKAYGDDVPPGSLVEPGETLIFEIEVKDVTEKKKVTEEDINFQKVPNLDEENSEE